MAWCVGAVFPNPDLLTGPAAAPLRPVLLDACDPPQCLFNTGSTYCYASHPQAHPHHQVEGFLGEYREAFFPQELLIETLQEDVTSQNCYSVGNRLEGLKNRDGRLQLFFPVGENIDRIGSCIFFPDSTAALARRKFCSDIDNDLLYSSSSSVRQPILQIAANRIGSSLGSELANVPLAARTSYQVHWLTSRIQNDSYSLTWEGVENFNHGTSDVGWNPHYPGEASVILENGDLNIFDLNSLKSSVASSIYRMEECIGKDLCTDEFSCSNHALCHKQKRRKGRGSRYGFNKSRITSATKNWWSCEYSWHPKNLVIGGHMEICLIDLRQKLGSKQFRCTLARSADCSSGLFSHCNQKYRTEHFTALTRPDYDDMFQFAAASTNHLTLYDVRQPNTPLLQWEHRMQLEPPRLLQMYRFSDVSSKCLDPLDAHLVGGRVILACAFRSGEIQAFLNGPQPQACSPNSERLKFERHMGGMGNLDKLYSWEFPIRLTNQKVHCHKNLGYVFETHENNLPTHFPKDCKVEQLTGLFNLSDENSGSSSFTILQLTGSGAILSQNLKVSEELGFCSHQHSGVVSEKTTIVRTSHGKCRTKQYRMEYLPAFLNYVQCGSVLPELKQKGYWNANNDQNANVANKEECSKNKAEEEQKTEPHDKGSCSPYLDVVKTTSPHHTTARPAPVGQEDQKFEFQSNKLGDDDGDQNTEDFFCELDTELSPVDLSFNDTGGISLQSEELVMLKGFKNLFLHWKQNFQPCLAHSNLGVNGQS
eukprot:c16085_g1_i1 orf=23-2311(-)